MLKCDDYECTVCKFRFERFWESEYEEGGYTICKRCGLPAERIYLKFANVDNAAFAAWNPSPDSDQRAFSDKKAFREDLKRKGKLIYEPGMDKQAEANDRHEREKAERKFKERAGKWFAEHTLDEVRNMIAVDKKIYEAQARGDDRAIAAMGGTTSLEQAKKDAESAPPVRVPLPPKVTESLKRQHGRTNP